MAILQACSNVYQGWTPGANTIAYYPLTATSQKNDMKGSGTAYNLTSNGTVSFGTYGGVSCCYINVGALYTSISSVSATAGITCNIWYNEVNVPPNDNGTIAWFAYSNPTQTGDYANGIVRAKGRPSSKYGIVGYTHGGSVVVTNAFTVTTGQWCNVCYTYQGTTMTLYVNGNLIGTATVTDTHDSKGYLCISRNVDINRSIKGYVSEAIFESKVRTATEISNYYNQTKSLYGIS